MVTKDKIVDKIVYGGSSDQMSNLILVQFREEIVYLWLKAISLSKPEFSIMHLNLLFSFVTFTFTDDDCSLG